MAQLFTSRATHLFRIAIVVGILVFVGLLTTVDLIPRTSYRTGLNKFVPQDVPFSHAHHVGEIGINCRFCHNYPEKSSYAGMPQSQICMKCHRVLFKDAPMLAPVRESFATGKPLVWNRVYDLQDFVYFNHSIHVRKGVACQTCHGDVAYMPFMRPAHDYFMNWCLSCHRAAYRYLGKKGDAELTRSITDCGTCHR